MTASRWRRQARHLRVRVTAAAALAAVVLACVGAVVFVVAFRASLRGGTDDALRAVAAGTVPDLRSSSDTPALPAGAAGSTASVLQLVGPDGRVRQTVAASSARRPAVDDARSTLVSAAELRAAASGQRLATRDDVRVVLTPFDRPDGTWVLLVAGDLDQVDNAARRAETAFFVVVPVVVVLIAAGAWLLSGAVLRPVERIRADAEALRTEVADGRPVAGRVHEPDSGDGIESLAVTLNGLLGDLSDAAERQRHLVADAGHELRTPLAVLRTELELADREGRDAAYLRDAVAHARAEVDRLSTLAEDLLLLADAEHRVQRDLRRVALGDVADRSARAFRAVAGERGVGIAVLVDGDTRVVGDPGSLRRVVDNLVGNAVSVARSAVTVTVTLQDATVLLTVDDDGPGFAADFLPHAFERFRRADDARHRTGPGGAGLGLAIVAAVAAAHGGRAAASNTATGARVTVTVPVEP